MAKHMQDSVVLFGDSLTQLQDQPRNLHERMCQAYERKMDIINRGFAGYNSNGGRAIFDRVFARKDDQAGSSKVRLVTIWHGTNDCVLPPKPQATSLERFIDNLTFFLEALTSPTSPYAIADTPVSIVLLTPGPCLSSMFPPQPYTFRTQERHKLYRDAVLEVGKRWKEKERSSMNLSGWAVETVDVWTAIAEAAGGLGEELRQFYTDGTHLSSAGYDIVWRELSETISTQFGGRGLEWEDSHDLPMTAPAWDTIDWQRPESIPDMMRHLPTSPLRPHTPRSEHDDVTSPSRKGYEHEDQARILTSHRTEWEGPPTPEEKELP